MIKRSLNIVVGVLAILLLTGTVKAEEKNYHVQTQESEVPSFSDRFKIKPSDAPRGIYITAVGGWSGTYPKVAQILQEKFKSKGFVIASKAEDADIGINFFAYGVDFEDIEENVAHVNGEAVTSHMAAAMLTGGISLISTGIQMMGKSKGMSSLVGIVYKSPLKLTSKGRVDAETDKKSGSVGRNFTADEANPTVQTDLFLLVLEDWMKEFTDTEAVTPPAIPVTSQVPLQPNADVKSVSK